ncbi:MAG: hypothetical protein VX709_16750 [Pseudomonadota bacterium]|nr:hypothetical protein [Pseudomonadota bacterium]
MIELLYEPAYRHVVFNHVPIIGLLISCVVLLAGLAMRQVAVLRLGLLMIAATAGASVPVADFGDQAYPEIFGKLDGTGREWLDYHIYLADTWLPLLYLNSLLAIAAFIGGYWRRPFLIPMAAVVAVVTLPAIVMASWIGYAGGKIKHPEFRYENPPVFESSRRLP